VKTSYRFLSLVLGAISSASIALAQDYPSRAVKVIVPFSPGGPGDLAARFVAKELQDSLGQPFVIDNRPGANGIVGADAAAKSPADGYTLLQISNSHTVNEPLIKNKPYALMRDFTPVAGMNYSELVFVVKNGLPASSVADVIRLAKEKPGGLNYASSGNGSAYHMAGELFKTMAGVNIAHVPYKSASAARADVMGGHIDMMFDALPAMLEIIKGAKVKVIGTTDKQRSPALPEVPTVSEAGLKGFEAKAWTGLLAPKNTPPAIVSKLNAEVNKIISRPETRKLWLSQGVLPLLMSVEEFTRYLNDDITQGTRLVEISGAKVD
jgi:tripartite-type tricarboxylate transporter receptor subunit TctC